MKPNYELQARIRACTRCPLHKLRDGIAVPAWVGEAYTSGGIAVMAQSPGAQEDATGVPLVGRAGRKFDRLSLKAGISREEYCLMNRVRCRPPGNKMAQHGYALVECEPWVEEELRAYDPGVVVVMGKEAIEYVFGKGLLVREARRTLRQFAGRTYLATYHPIARNPAYEALIVEDLRLAKELRDA